MDKEPFRKRVPARLRGLMLLAIGVGLGWWQIRRPLTALDRGDTEVTVSNFGVGGAVILTILGFGLAPIGQGLENALESMRLTALGFTRS